MWQGYSGASSEEYVEYTELWNASIKEMMEHGSNKEKVHPFPLSRVKKVMKMDELIKIELEKENSTQNEQGNNPPAKLMIAAESPVLLGKACELLIKDLSIRSWLETKKSKRKTVQKPDVLSAVSNNEMFDFLLDIMHQHFPAHKHVKTQPFSTDPSSEINQPRIPMNHDLVHEIPTINHSGTSTSLAGQGKSPEVQHFESLNHQSQQVNLPISQSQHVDNGLQDTQHDPLHIANQPIHVPNLNSANTNATLHPNDALILLSPQHPQDSQEVQEAHNLNQQLSLQASPPTEMHLLSPHYPEHIQGTREIPQMSLPSHPSDHNQSDFLSSTLQPSGGLNVPSPRQFQNTIHPQEEIKYVLQNSEEPLHQQQSVHMLNLIEQHPKEDAENEHKVDHSIPLLRDFTHQQMHSMPNCEK